MADSGDTEFSLETPDLRTLLERVKRFSPALARDLRRELRRSGDSAIAAQRAVLAGPKPGRVRVSGKTVRLIRPRNGRAPYLRAVNTYEDYEASNRSRGMRQQISAGLSTRVSTGKTRNGVTIRTSRAKAPMSITWQARMFRHPVFESGAAWQPQRGQPYFWEPVTREFAHIRRRITDAIDRAIAQIQ